jgi:hypothetical protein
MLVCGKSDNVMKKRILENAMSVLRIFICNHILTKGVQLLLAFQSNKIIDTGDVGWPSCLSSFHITFQMMRLRQILLLSDRITTT